MNRYQVKMHKNQDMAASDKGQIQNERRIIAE